MNLPTAEASTRDWKAILLSAFFIAGAAFVFLISLALALLGISTSADYHQEQPISILMLSAGTFAMAVLLIPAIILNIRRAINKPGISVILPNPGNRVILPGLILAWVICLLIGQFLARGTVITLLFFPILNIFGIALPILFYLRISLNGLKLPEARRGWSLFGATMLVSPLLAFILESVLIGLIALSLMIMANFRPELQETLRTLSLFFLPNTENQDELMRSLANLLFSPGVIASIIAIFSLAIPIIEESAKIILILPLLKKINHPVQGYVLGIFCGATFAFVENLGFGSAGSTDWVMNAIIRATSALPHILNSGVLGWALVSAWQEHKYWKLGKAFLAVILIHGSWNAISLGFTLNALSPYIVHIPSIFQYSFPWLVGWMVLASGILLGLIFINRDLRKLLS